MWYDDIEYCDDDDDDDDDDDEDNFFKWYDGYKKRKVHRASIKEELIPINCISQDGWIGVCQKMKKVMQRNCGNKQDLFVSGDQIQKNFDLKELQRKVSSVTPFTFNAVELCVVTINEKPCTHAREVWRALEYGKATKAADVVADTFVAEKITLISGN